ncbi:hypothetical protein POTOM_023554 [Populus tomentosa]|uniref:Uncharacterized protein n=1 Tax=Populus tomentosa TaxID=118781 RepID=A0A8X7ZTL7_POPTO|nr:hypothetical protein POTOM_023554 [Populus tomentosa]
MALEDERIVTLYQVDPGFYKKILSRNSSLSSSKSISACYSPGQVPFIWEKQPGKPREAPKIEKVRPIRLPPAAHGFSMQKPRFHHSSPMACFSKCIEKLKMIKNMQLRFPPAVPSLRMQKPEIPHLEVKVKILQSLEKVKKIKNNIHFRKKIKRIHLSKKSKAKPVETNGYASCTGDSDSFRSCIIGGDFTPSRSNSDVSCSSCSPSFSSDRVKRWPKKLGFCSLSKKLRKWRINKR